MNRIQEVTLDICMQPHITALPMPTTCLIHTTYKVLLSQSTMKISCLYSCTNDAWSWLFCLPESRVAFYPTDKSNSGIVFVLQLLRKNLYIFVTFFRTSSLLVHRSALLTILR
jgi:hypothetical protein